jgi:valyl-tRNA synthetase
VLDSYKHKEVEEKWSKTWLEKDLYKAKIDSSKESFSIALPPPNVTGELHMGHALSGTIQDVILRYQRMKGKNVHWQIGTDHAGIGTQIVVEKDLKAKEGKTKYDLGRDKFVERVRAWKDEYGVKIFEQMKLLGFSPDYSRARYTMDDHYAHAVKETFIKYFNDGLIYRGKRIVNWCPKCLTSLSDLEIDKEACKKKLYEINYYFTGSDKFLTVATTRPETMFGDVAVAINPEDERYTELIKQVKEKPGSVTLMIPISGKEIPLVLDEHVKTDFGTGALKVTPAHDANDYDIAQRVGGLDMPIIFDETGCLKECSEVPNMISVIEEQGEEKIAKEICLWGLNRYKARDAVLNCPELVLNKISEYEQEKDLHDRCGTEIEPYLSDQWYVDMKSLAKLALESESSGRVQFKPERYSQIYKTWLENIQDWCVSRQIWWGHQIPVYYYEVDSATEKSFEKNGKHYEYYAAHLPKDPSHIQDEDVLDTWFSSALWPFETLKDDPELFDQFYPTDILATAREIINLWVSRMIFSSEYFENKAPYKDILIHPVVQTPDGKRMSKSKGNAIDPIDMINKYGADASRMWYASVGVFGNQDVRFPGRKDKKEGWLSDTFEQYRKFANKLYNAAKFVSIQLGDDFKVEELSSLNLDNLNSFDKWILNKFQTVLENETNAYDAYDLATAQKEIYEFLWFDFCDWYIEFTKQSDVTNEQKQILFYILEASLRVLQPIMPHITEEIWQVYNSKYKFSSLENLLFAEFPKAIPEFKYEQDENNNVDYLISIIGSLRNTRQSLGISWQDQIEIMFASESEAEKNTILSNIEVLKNILKAQEIKELDSEPKPANIAMLGKTKIVVPLEGLVDLDKVKENLSRKLNKLQGQISGLEKRLSSDNFINNASKEKIEETRAQLEEQLKEKSLFESELSYLG